MHEAVEKLRAEKERLTAEYKETQKEYKTEIKRIDTAIRKFNAGYSALGRALTGEPRKNATAEIEKILAEKGEPMHVKMIEAELIARGFEIMLPSISSTLINYSKAGKKFVKTAPATFALLRSQQQPAARPIRVIKAAAR